MPSDADGAAHGHRLKLRVPLRPAFPLPRSLPLHSPAGLPLPPSQRLSLPWRECGLPANAHVWEGSSPSSQA
eukprot:6198987-Pleurochrysis_carterae.AAC.1